MGILSNLFLVKWWEWRGIATICQPFSFWWLTHLHSSSPSILLHFISPFNSCSFMQSFWDLFKKNPCKLIWGFLVCVCVCVIVRYKKRGRRNWFKLWCFKCWNHLKVSFELVILYEIRVHASILIWRFLILIYCCNIPIILR